MTTSLIINDTSKAKSQIIIHFTSKLKIGFEVTVDKYHKHSIRTARR